MASFADDAAPEETLPDAVRGNGSTFLCDDRFESEQSESQITEGESSDNHDSGFYERSPLGSDTSNIPPPAHEIDQWQRHISLQNFAKDLQTAANSVYPNKTRSRYSRVYVLIFKWKAEDPKLPVSYEIAELREVLGKIYHYDIEVFEIPEKQSHARVSEKINTFVAINDDSKDDLKIVYYAGHGRLSKTRDLVWTSFQSKRNEKCFTVTWSGIQKALEQAQSDVLILLDCCSSGIGDAGEGNGVTELMSACAFDMTANGVGHYSFTKALTIELRLLSKKRSFPVVELYTHIYCRAQHHMAQGIDNERYPAPIHLLLTRDDHFPRSIQLSIQEPHPEQDLSLEPGHSSYELNPARPVNHKRRLSRESAESPKKRPCLDENNSSLEAGLDSSITQYWGAPQDVALQNDCAGSEVGLMSNNESAIFGRYPRDSLQLESAHAPRLLFAVRLEENIRAEDLSPEYFTDWLRMIPTIAREVRVEAGFECNSTLLLVSLPLCLKPYLPHHSAIISLGPVKSSNLLAESYLREEMATIKRDSHFSPETAENERRAAASGESEPREMIQADDQPDTGSEGFAESYISSCESLKSDFEKYPEENGRTYHSYNAGRYMFPNDEPEKDRLDLQNHLFSLTFGGKLCVSPVTQTNTIHCVLDVGTGTGIWAIDFAVEHPGAKVIGVDLSPIQPKFVPPNLCFEIADLEDSWTFHEKFDFIYCRMMTASIRNWPQFFTNSFENLTPGGYLEVADICFPVQVDDASLHNESALRKWSDLMLEATQKAGSPINSAKLYKSQLEIAGFCNVVEVQYKWPQNSWPANKHLKELGRWNQENMLTGIEGFSMAPFTRILGWSKEEVEKFLVAVKEEIKQNSIHAYWNIYVVNGQKPV